MKTLKFKTENGYEDLYEIYKEEESNSSKTLKVNTLYYIRSLDGPEDKNQNAIFALNSDNKLCTVIDDYGDGYYVPYITKDNKISTYYREGSYPQPTQQFNKLKELGYDLEGITLGYSGYYRYTESITISDVVFIPE